MNVRQAILKKEAVVERLTAEVSRLKNVLQAARWVDMHVPSHQIAGLVTRNHFDALSAALKEYDDE